MDDNDLSEIQLEVDAVLERLRKHIEKESRGPANKEDAAAAIYNYITPHSRLAEQKVSLSEAVQHAANAKAWSRAIDEQAHQHLDDDEANLIAAVDLLSEWGRFGGHPLQPHHMRVLWVHTFRYREGVTSYIGEEAGLPLKKSVMRDKDYRMLACDYLLQLRAQPGGKKRYPLSDELTWEDIGALFKVKGGTLREFYYSEYKPRFSPKKL